MAKKTTRVRKTKSSWKKWLLALLPVLLVGFIFLNSNSESNVLGVSDKNIFNLGSKKESSKLAKPTPIPSCNRVVSFGANTICEVEANSGKANNAFSSYSYSCEDGTSGNIAQVSAKCIPLDKAFNSAKKECNKKCRPSVSPKAQKTL